MSIVHEPDGPARRACQLGGEQPFRACALLATEPTADELRDHPDGLEGELEPSRQLRASIEHRLGGDPGRQLVPVPPRHGRMGLERGLEVPRGLARELDGDVRLRQALVGVAARQLDGSLTKRLLVQADIEVDLWCQRRDRRRERAECGCGRIRRVGGDDRDRLAGELGARRQQGVADHRKGPVGPDHRPDARASLARRRGRAP